PILHSIFPLLLSSPETDLPSPEKAGTVPRFPVAPDLSPILIKIVQARQPLSRHITKNRQSSILCRLLILCSIVLLSNNSSCAYRSSVEGAGDFNSSFWIWSGITCVYNLSSTDVDSYVVDSSAASVE